MTVGTVGDIPVIQRYMNLSNIFRLFLWQLGYPDYQQAKAKK